jgi:hypothetical protein
MTAEDTIFATAIPNKIRFVFPVVGVCLLLLSHLRSFSWKINEWFGKVSRG